MTEPLKDGQSKGQLISRDDLKIMLDEYYTARGWAIQTGIASRARLIELDLDYVADALAV